MKNKRILITGGAGFIANAVMKHLVSDNELVIYDNFARDTFSGSELAGHERIRVIRGDVLDFDNLSAALEGVDAVIHAAAIAGIDTVLKNPVHTMRVNMLGTANLLEAARLHGIQDRVVVFSTSEVFGQMAYKSSETDHLISGSAGEARWTYAVSKLAGEHLAKAYHTQYGLPTVTVRPFNIYGPGQTGEGAMRIFIQKALRNEVIEIDGDGTQIRAWCYVDDFIDGLLRCLDVPEAVGESFNIGNPRAVITVLGLAQTVCRVLDSRSDIIFAPPLSADVQLRIPSIDKAVKLLGFHSEIDLEEGIRRTAEWLKQHG